MANEFDESVPARRAFMALMGVSAALPLTACMPAGSAPPDDEPYDDEVGLATEAATGSSIRWVDTMSELRGLAPTSNPVRLLGYHSAGDGGGGWFKWNASDTTPPSSPLVDGLVVIRNGTPAPPGRWVRVQNDTNLRAAWWGLRRQDDMGSYATTNVTALQKAVDAAIARGAPLYIEAGSFWLDNKIVVANVQGFRFIGASSGAYQKATEFYWSGGTTSAMFELIDVENSRFADFGILSSDYKPLATGIWSYNAAGGNIAPGSNTFERIRMNGTNGHLHKGFRFGGCSQEGSSDANNSECLFHFCTVANFAFAAFSFEAGQSKAHTLFHCHVSGIGNANSYGVYVVSPNGACQPAGYGGSFRWFGGNVGNVHTAFQFANFGDDTLIHGVMSEGCSRLLAGGGPTDAVGAISLAGIRFSMNGVPDTNTPHAIVDCRCPGPVTIQGLNVDNGSGHKAPYLQVFGGSLGQLVAIGNCIQSDDPKIFHAYRLVAMGNMRVSAPPSNVGSYMADCTGAGATAHRPSSAQAGAVFFDTTLGRAIWHNGSTWIDAAGIPV